MPHIDWKTLPMVALVALVAGAAAAGTVYRWTDENGTVHFGDVPPPHLKDFKTESLPDAPTPAAEAAAALPAGAAKAGDAPAPQGPARVVLSDQHAEAVNPGVQSFRGKVKNEGGSEARDVSIAIVVTEPTQGDECLHEAIDVDPSTLAPGAEGTYEAEFENPCFQGPTQAALHAEWR